VQRKFFTEAYIDRKHKILACIPPKSGSTTWKAILANNTMEEALPGNFNLERLHGGPGSFLYQAGVSRLFQFNETMRQYILANYLKILVTRHPFERVRSAYINKIESGVDRIMERKYAKKIWFSSVKDVSSRIESCGPGNRGRCKV
jgi:hypothetical protein